MKVIGVTIVVIGVVVVALVILTGSQSTLSDDEEAWYMGKQIVEEHLKAPSTAKFGNIAARGSSHMRIGPAQFEVGGMVDSQNTFGAMLRNKWIVVVTKVGDRWRTDYMKLGDDESGKYPSPSSEPEREAPAPPPITATSQPIAYSAPKIAPGRWVTITRPTSVRFDDGSVTLDVDMSLLLLADDGDQLKIEIAGRSVSIARDSTDIDKAK